MTLWYTARGAALAALIALSVATALGALVSLPSRNAARRVIVQYAHRSAAVLGIGLLALHVTAIVLDSKAHVSLLGALVPFTSGYRPEWVGLGTIALYLMLGVDRARPGPRPARRIRTSGTSLASAASAVLRRLGARDRARPQVRD